MRARRGFNTSAGPPTLGSFDVGDAVTDAAGVEWICTAAGAPGSWSPAGAGASAASSVSVDPTGLTVVTGTDVQAAIEELDAASGGGSGTSIAGPKWTDVTVPTAEGDWDNGGAVWVFNGGTISSAGGAFGSAFIEFPDSVPPCLGFALAVPVTITGLSDPDNVPALAATVANGGSDAPGGFSGSGIYLPIDGGAGPIGAGNIGVQVYGPGGNSIGAPDPVAGLDGVEAAWGVTQLGLGAGYILTKDGAVLLSAAVAANSTPAQGAPLRLDLYYTESGTPAPGAIQVNLAGIKLAVLTPAV